MVSFSILKIEDVKMLVDFCNKYDEDIDVIYRRYVVDGKSYLGVASLIGHIVSISIHTDDKEKYTQFHNELYRLCTGVNKKQ